MESEARTPAGSAENHRTQTLHSWGSYIPLLKWNSRSRPKTLRARPDKWKRSSCETVFCLLRPFDRKGTKNDDDRIQHRCQVWVNVCNHESIDTDHQHQFLIILPFIVSYLELLIVQMRRRTPGGASSSGRREQLFAASHGWNNESAFLVPEIPERSVRPVERKQKSMLAPQYSERKQGAVAKDDSVANKILNLI